MVEKIQNDPNYYQYICPGIIYMHIWASSHIINEPSCCPTKTKILQLLIKVSEMCFIKGLICWN